MGMTLAINHALRHRDAKWVSTGRPTLCSVPGMGNEPRMTASVLKVMSAFLADLGADRHGLDLMQDTGLASGTLYPILIRLQRAGWIARDWERIDPIAEHRPARRCYRMTPNGVITARRAVTAVQRRRSRMTGVSGLAVLAA
jgi:PadR family transcriptional regulator PadR